MRKYGLIILISLYSLLSIDAEVFSSIAKMESLITTQKRIIDSLNYLIKVKNVQNKFLLNHLRRFEMEHREAVMDIPKYLENPVNCYRLIKRLTVDCESIMDMLNESDFMKNKSLTYPTDVDLKGSAEAMLRLRQTYDIDISETSSGFWNTSYGKNGKFMKTFNPMTISDCFVLGKVLSESHLNDGIKWLKVALKKFIDERYKYPEDGNMTEEYINKEISNELRRQNFMTRKYNNWHKSLASLLPDLETYNPVLLMDCFKNNLTPFEAVKEIVANIRASPEVPNTDYSDTVSIVNDLCKGIAKQNNQIKDMKCYLASGPHSFLKLAPIRAEVLHRAPITLFYDVIHESEIEYIKNLVLPTISRAKIGNEKEPNNARICQTALADGNDRITAQVRKRIEEFTGFNLAYSEDLQVTNYGIAGHNTPHPDYWCDETMIAKYGKRLATVLLYLSNVEQGGATVFHKLGLSVYPVRGAALYWTNLMTSGEGNPLMDHAACPVLWGSKWVATQWIMDRGQELTMPCRIDGKG